MKLEQHFTCDPHVVKTHVIYMWNTCDVTMGDFEQPHVVNMRTTCNCYPHVVNMWLTCEPDVTNTRAFG